MLAKNSKVGFTGPFADTNFGDYAMLVNNVYDIKATDIVLFSYDSHFSHLIKNDYFSELNVNVVDIDISGEMRVEEGNKYKSLTPIEILHYIENYDTLASIIYELDVLVVNGGGYINSLWSMPHRFLKLVKIFAPILIANNLNKRIVFTGNSYGPFSDDAEFFACMLSVLKDAVFGSRDNLFSPKWAQLIGLNEGRFEYIPDDLFFISQTLIKRHPRCRLPLNKYLVIETYLPVDFIEKNIDSFQKFSQLLFERHNLELLFIPFNTYNGGMDQAICLNSKLRHFSFYDIGSPGYLSIEDAVYLVKNAEFVLCSRYHALILALAQRIPVVSVLKDVIGDKRYYYNKNLGILRQVFHDVIFDERDYMRLDFLEAMVFIVDHYEDIKKRQNDNFNMTYQTNVAAMKSNRELFISRFIGDNN